MISRVSVSFDYVRGRRPGLVMRALNRRVERVFNPSKDKHWGRRKWRGIS